MLEKTPGMRALRLAQVWFEGMVTKLEDQGKEEQFSDVLSTALIWSSHKQLQGVFLDVLGLQEATAKTFCNEQVTKHSTDRDKYKARVRRVYSKQFALWPQIYHKVPCDDCGWPSREVYTNFVLR